MNEVIQLGKWDQAKRAIAACTSVDELKQIRDKAQALMAYAKQARESLEVQNNVADIKIRCERRIGEFSKQLPQNKLKGLKNATSPHDGETKTSILKQAGIKHHERYESISNLPEEEFEAHIKNVKKSNEELTTIGLLKLARTVEHKKKVKKIKEDFEASELPNKKYSIIYADPPWEYYAGGLKNQSGYYKNMPLDEIIAMPVKNITNDDCILFLWVTFPMLQECFKVIESWGFQYSTCGFVWVKMNKNENTPFFGLGNWTRSNAEVCLIATKGSIKRMDASISQILMTRIEEHSKKPDILRHKIVDLVGDLPRIELFARTKTEGWDVWGNEA